MRPLPFLFATALAVGGVSCTPSVRAPGSIPRVVGYLASWGVRTKGTHIADLPAGDLTHIFYAFASIDKDGRVALGDPCVDTGVCPPSDSTKAASDVAEIEPGGNFRELQRLKSRNPHLRLLISVGGWTGSGGFSDAALTAASRRRFAESALDVFIRARPGLFDGIDIDWEFPVGGGMEGNVERPVDRANFTLLLAELRRQLDAQGTKDNRRYELTIAASARAPEIANIDLPRIEPLLDFINVMTYDYHSAPGTTNFNSPLYSSANDPTPTWNVDASMVSFIKRGVPAKKLLVGVPFYGHAYGQVPNVNAGLFQPGTRNPVGWQSGSADWKAIVETRLNDSRYVRHWEPTARVPWLYDSTSGTWVSYDDPESVAAKAAYVRQRRLGGVVIWELGGDDDYGRLMRAITDGLRGSN